MSIDPEDYAIKTIRDKDKRIEELEFQLKGFQANYNDTGKLVNGLRKRITELEAKIEEFIYIESHGEDILSEGGAGWVK